MGMRNRCKKMFELYATGTYSLAKLRKKMLDDGMVYRNGKNFHPRKRLECLRREMLKKSVD